MIDRILVYDLHVILTIGIGYCYTSAAFRPISDAPHKIDYDDRWYHVRHVAVRTEELVSVVLPYLFRLFIYTVVGITE